MRGVFGPVALERSSGRRDPRAVKADAFRKAVRALGDARVYELRDLPIDPSYHLDVALLSPSYNGSEGFWFPQSKDWLLYASHEGSLTAAGEVMIRLIEALWPEWGAHPPKWC